MRGSDELLANVRREAAPCRDLDRVRTAAVRGRGVGERSAHRSPHLGANRGEPRGARHDSRGAARAGVGASTRAESGAARLGAHSEQLIAHCFYETRYDRRGFRDSVLASKDIAGGEVIRRADGQREGDLSPKLDIVIHAIHRLHTVLGELEEFAVVRFEFFLRALLLFSWFGDVYEAQGLTWCVCGIWRARPQCEASSRRAPRYWHGGPRRQSHTVRPITAWRQPFELEEETSTVGACSDAPFLMLDELYEPLSERALVLKIREHCESERFLLCTVLQHDLNGVEIELVELSALDALFDLQFHSESTSRHSALEPSPEELACGVEDVVAHFLALVSRIVLNTIRRRFPSSLVMTTRPVWLALNARAESLLYWLLVRVRLVFLPIVSPPVLVRVLRGVNHTIPTDKICANGNIPWRVRASYDDRRLSAENQHGDAGALPSSREEVAA